jgi:tol-pal system protein YbgF
VQRLSELDGRLLRIERILSNQSLLDQAQKVDALTNDTRALRGQAEQLQHQQESAKKQQRDLYADLDKRLQALESKPVAVSNAANSSSADDNAAYKQALDLLNAGKYDEATTAFSQFITAYPQSALLDNAQYWLGEAHYVKDFGLALKSFQTLVDKFPESRKVPDAWLKIGYCQYELKNWKAARDALKKAQQFDPDSKVGKLAQQRLAKLQAEGH